MLFVGLCRGDYVVYEQGFYALARVSGNAFRVGDDIPTSGVD